jgi:hypothetical protein
LEDYAGSCEAEAAHRLLVNNSLQLQASMPTKDENSVLRIRLPTVDSFIENFVGKRIVSRNFDMLLSVLLDS